MPRSPDLHVPVVSGASNSNEFEGSATFDGQVSLTSTTHAMQLNSTTTGTVASAAEGQIIYDTATDGPWFYNSAWVRLPTMPVSAVAATGSTSQKEGAIILNAAGPITLTIPDPVSGTDDGRVLHITAAVQGAHVIRAVSASKINGNTSETLPNQDAGEGLSLVAYAGSWYTIGTTTVNATAVLAHA